jgi:hypothetical protein
MLCYTDPSGCESWCVMLSQLLWIMVCYAKPVVVNHVCYAEPNSCESCCEPLAQHYTPWLTITGSALHTMIHNHCSPNTHHDSQPWSSITQHNSQPLGHIIHNLWLRMTIAMLCQRLWIMACYSEPVVVNHGALFWASGCESCVILSSGCESWWAMLSQWTWFTTTSSE